MQNHNPLALFNVISHHQTKHFSKILYQLNNLSTYIYISNNIIKTANCIKKIPMWNINSTVVCQYKITLIITLYTTLNEVHQLKHYSPPCSSAHRLHLDRLSGKEKEQRLILLKPSPLQCAATSSSVSNSACRQMYLVNVIDLIFYFYQRKGENSVVLETYIPLLNYVPLKQKLFSRTF